MLAALYLALVVAPLEAVQGVHQRIFYMHVPVAMMAYLAFVVVLVGSVLYLWKRDSKWDALAKSSAEIGVVATTLVLITGSLWGRPVWGAFWSWSDARLVTTLVLWLIYVAYLMLRSLGGPGPRIARFAAVLGILGFVDVPLTYVSVFLWTFLHPKPTLVPGGVVPGPILAPFLVSLLAFTLLYVYLLTQRYRLERDREELAALRQRLGL
ncbi:MAG: cytochrome c biogenesis protein CcsA [Chloroflexi bacterium]|nr:cytochrome c biogenesis protein CcsA [Chloroflexota bacterium]